MFTIFGAHMVYMVSYQPLNILLQAQFISFKILLKIRYVQNVEKYI